MSPSHIDSITPKTVLWPKDVMGRCLPSMSFTARRGYYSKGTTVATTSRTSTSRRDGVYQAVFDGDAGSSNVSGILTQILTQRKNSRGTVTRNQPNTQHLAANVGGILTQRKYI